VETLHTLLTHMFNPTSKEIPGLRLIKLYESENTRHYAYGDISGTPFALVCTNEAFLLYQFMSQGAGRGGAFRKTAQFKNTEVAASCTGLFHGAGKFFGIRDGQFHVFHHQIGVLAPLFTAQHTSQYPIESTVAICAKPVSDNLVLMCFEKIGLLVDPTKEKVQVERMFIWKSAVQAATISHPYIIVYGQQLIEVWEYATGHLVQLNPSNTMTILDVSSNHYLTYENDLPQLMVFRPAAK
jgi:hypothetical protein